MPFLCEMCQDEMEWRKQKYLCRRCGHINPCCEETSAIAKTADIIKKI